MALSGTLNTNSPAIADNRYYQLTWTASQSVANNTSTINWTLKMVAGDPAHQGWIAERTLKVVIDGNVVVNKTNRVERYPGTIASGSLTLNHNANGKRSFSASIQAAQYYSDVNTTGSASFTLNDIPRQATITSAPDFNDEENPTIYYTNSAGNNVSSLQACISLTGSSADVAYRDISKTGTSYTFNLTDAERKVLRAATTGSNSRTVRFYVKTVIGGNTYYNAVPKTFTIVNAGISMTPIVEDINSVSLALTGNKEKFIKYISNAKVAANATALKEGTITEISIACGGKKITTASGTINAVESGQFSFWAKDNRGNVKAWVLNKTLVNYVKPTCVLKVENPTAEGDCSLTITGKAFFGVFGVEANEVEIEYRYKENNGSYGGWNTVDPSSNTISDYTANVTVSGLNYQSSYTFQARLSDTISDYIYTQEISVKSLPIFDWGENDFNFNVPVTIEGRGYKENRILWSGASHMNGGQTANLSEPISAQPHGIVVVFTGYDNSTATVKDASVNTFFVSKDQVALLGETAGHTFILGINAGFSSMAAKYLYFTDTSVKGHTGNTTSGTNSGITFNNSNYVLRYVIGV